MCSTPTPLKEACKGELWVAYDHSLEDSYGLCILVKELKAENLENKKIICQLGHCVRKELYMWLRLIPLILWSNPLNVCEEVSSSVTFSTILICTATGRLVCLCFMQCKFLVTSGLTQGKESQWDNCTQIYATSVGEVWLPFPRTHLPTVLPTACQNCQGKMPLPYTVASS